MASATTKKATALLEQKESLPKVIHQITLSFVTFQIFLANTHTA
jgi:hypothetical protein